MLKRIIGVLLASALLVSMFAACGKKADEQADSSTAVATTQEEKRGPVTMSVVGIQIDDKSGFPKGMDEKTNVWLDYYKSDLDVTITQKWVVPSAQADDKMNLQIASGDVPDLMKVNQTQYATLVESDMVEDLTAVYESKSNQSLKDIAAMDGGIAVNLATRNDKLLGLPYFNEGVYTRSFWIRKDWLAKLGLEMPKTMEELYSVAKAFIEKDPDGNGKKDTMGIGMQMSQNINSLEAVLTGFNAYANNMWVEGTDGKAILSAITPNAKKALDFMQRLYKDKLISPEFATITDDQISKDIVSGKCGITTWQFWAPYWSLINNKTADPKAEWATVYVTEDGSSAKIPTSKKPGLYFAMRKGFEHPEIVVEMANKFAEVLIGSNKLEDSLKYVQGAAGENFWQFAIVYFWPPINQDVEPFNEAVVKRDRNACPPIRLGDYDNSVKFLDNKDISGWGSYVCFGPDSQYLQNIKLLRENSSEDGVYFGSGTPTMTEKGADLDKILLQGYAKYISGEKGITFDKIVSDWLAAGGQKITDEVNAEIAK